MASTIGRCELTAAVERVRRSLSDKPIREGTRVDSAARLGRALPVRCGNRREGSENPASVEAGRGLRVDSSQLRGDSGRGAAAVEGRFGGRWGSSVVKPLSRRAVLRSGPRANVYGGAAWAAALPPTNKDEQLGTNCAEEACAV